MRIHRHHLILFLCLATLAWLTAPVRAAGEVELIQLEHRQARELIALLKPHLETDEGLTGEGYRLIVRARPERIAALRELIRELDSAPARIRISVRQASAGEIRADNRALAARVRIEDGEVSAQGGGHLYATTRRTDNTSAHVVNALEGQPAFIAEGLAFPSVGTTTRIIDGRPVATPNLEYRQLQSGFYALARLSDGAVTVIASPRREALSPRGGGMIESAALTTTVRGPLGQWLELGGMGETTDRDSAGTLYRTQDRRQDRNRLWIRVDRLGN